MKNGENMGKKKVELTEEQKKRRDRVNEIIKKDIENRKEGMKAITEILDEIREPFDKLVDVILFKGNEIVRAKVAEVLIETLIIRMSLKGYTVAGLIEYIKQQLVTHPLLSVSFTQGRRYLDDANIKAQKQKKGSTKYIR